MSNFVRSLPGLIGLMLVALSSFAAHAGPYVSPDLADWVPWVLEKHPEQTCPFQAAGEARLCDAPSLLRLTLDQQGGTFELQGHAFTQGWVGLPGDAFHWPQDVRLGGQPVSTGAHDAMPAVWLPQGAYSLTGRFTWSRLPDIFHIPQQTALIDLRINGKSQPHVGRPQADRIWVGRQAAEASGAEADRLSLSVYRKIIDAVPMEVTTVYRLEVSGRQREVQLPAPLLEGFTPTRTDSPLPMRLDRDGTFQLQVRPGVWDVTVSGRSKAELTRLSAPAFADAQYWPESEIWVFEARPEMRLVELAGAPSIDPTQVPLPAGWGAMPTYRMTPGTELVFDIKRRGDPEPEANQLNLAREVWLDFDGRGYTVRDQISGTVAQGWRLDALESNHIGYLALNGTPQLITRMSEESPAGVELRHGTVRLAAESRIENDGSGLAAVGWDHPFQSVKTQLRIPPGWKVFSISGVDNVPGSWVQRWTLFDLFLVLVTTVAAARMWGVLWGAVFLVTLTLLWHEAGAPQWTWINLIVVIALLRVVGDVKRLKRSLQIYQAITAVALVLLLIPFSVDQIRTSFYPQLQRPHQPIQGYEPAPMPEAPPLPQTEMDEAMSADRPALRQELKGRAKSLEGVLSSSIPYSYELDRVDPQAKLQTGPGLPQWQWDSVHLSWNGPVQPEQTVGIVYLTPAVNSLLNWLRVALSLLLAWHLLRGMIPMKPQALLSALIPFLLLPVMLSHSAPAAADYPPADLLNELEQRLLQPPKCLPDCAAIPRARLSVADNDVLQLRLDVHVSETVGIPLPGRAGHWEPNLVTVDGQMPPLTRAAEGTLYATLQPGIHSLVMQGGVSGANAVQLHFPLVPKRLEVNAEGWDITGFREPGVPGQQMHLTRLKPDDAREAAWEPVTVPPFVVLSRTLSLGLDWEVEHQVVRVTPVGKSVALRVPLLPGESVLTEGVQIRNGFAEVNLGPNQSSFQWRSRLEKNSPLELRAADHDAWTEVWRFAVSPVWHVEYDGIAPVHHTDRSSRWLPTWHPWPGETVTAVIQRPEGIPGPTATIQSASLSFTPGKRASDAQLQLSIRSSQGSKHRVLIQEDAALLSVTVDGQAQPIRQEGREVLVPLHPGAQSIDIKWRSSDSVTTRTRSPDIDPGGPLVNASIQMILGYDRWILWTDGPAMGPAVLFWGVIIVIVLVAFVLGRVHLTPLKTWQWALLGIGLSQVPLPFALVVVAWFFVMAYRGRGTVPAKPLEFNLMQVGLAIMTLFAIGAVLAAVQNGLLGMPDMWILGNDSGAYLFNWYQDRWQDGYPQASVISVPLIVYRLLMLAWALWLAFASVNWLRWGWQQYSNGGLYRPRATKPDAAC